MRACAATVVGVHTERAAMVSMVAGRCGVAASSSIELKTDVLTSLVDEFTGPPLNDNCAFRTA